MDPELSRNVSRSAATSMDFGGTSKQLGEQSQQASTENIFDDVPADDPAGEVFAIAESLAKRSKSFRDWIHFDDIIGKLLKDVEQRTKNAVYDPVVHADLSEDDFHSLIRDVARAGRRANVRGRSQKGPRSHSNQQRTRHDMRGAFLKTRSRRNTSTSPMKWAMSA